MLWQHQMANPGVSHPRPPAPPRPAPAPPQDAKKNMLKVQGASWLVCAAQSLYYASEDTMRKVGGGGTVPVLCLYYTLYCGCSCL